MSRVIFHKLQRLDEALNKILSLIRVMPTETIDIDSALNRVLAEDIYAPISLPPFDRSSVDGYAVRSSDIAMADEHRPVKLKIKGKIGVGMRPYINVNEGEAVEVDTGSAIPPGADSVIMEEFISKHNDELICYKNTSTGENIFHSGTDVMVGELVLTKGTRIGIKEITLLTSLGIDKVKVYRRPKVAIISTGKELIAPGYDYKEFKVYDSNGYMISAFLRELGCSIDILGIVPDDYDMLKSLISEASASHDFIITSGGTSAGEEDIVYHVLSDIGKIIVHGLMTRPGKPTVVAIVEGKLVIGLPGHPVSAFMILNALVRPIILKALGCTVYKTSSIKAKLSRKVPLRKGYLNIIPVALISDNGSFIAYPTFKGSGLISSIIPSDGYIEISGNREYVSAGMEVEVKLFNNKLVLPDLTFIGSHCLVTDKILNELKREGFIVRGIYVGSLEGLKAVIRGEADISGIHLLDERTHEYNIPFIKMYGAEDSVVLIKGFKRTQGLVVKKGNPKSIKGLEDLLLQHNIRFVNRNKGSGTRILLDIKLKELCKKLNLNFNKVIRRLNGYSWEVFTHTAVALAIKHDKADVGMAIEYAASLMNLDFIPVATEEYDYVVPKRKLNRKPIQRFIKLLKALKDSISLPGVQFHADTGEIIEI